MNSLLKQLQELDEKLFLAVNHYGHLPILDSFMLLLRNAITWVPLYLFILIWALVKFKKHFLPFLVLSLATFAVADYTSASILKPMFQRVRPCYNPGLSNMINMLTGCGGMYSMPSSHATNHFALATFWFWAMYIAAGKKWHWLWLWAAIICYAQVYVGKHYPFDVVAGCIYGIFIGTLMAKAFEFWIDPNKKINKQQLHQPKTMAE